MSRLGDKDGSLSLAGKLVGLGRCLGATGDGAAGSLPLVDACALGIARGAKLAGSETRRGMILCGRSKRLTPALCQVGRYTMLKSCRYIQIGITLLGML